MQNAATHLNAELILENWGDGTADSTAGVLQQWANLFDSADDMVDWVGDAISNFKPDLILSFDPRHGTYCHKDHMAAGYLAYTAANKIDYDLSKFYLLEHDMKV
jgi:LmbE family N-acetylglucosaminyl deacetylase